VSYKKIMLVVALVLGLTLLAHADPALAVFKSNAADEACKGVGLGSSGCAGGSQLNTIITNVVNVMSILVGIASVIMIMVGGFKYITSAGDSSKAGTAKSTIVYAVIGLVLVAFAQFIVQFVLNKTT
jgi:hypothetical protein